MLQPAVIRNAGHEMALVGVFLGHRLLAWPPPVA